MFGAGDPLGRLPASRRGGKAAEAGLAQAGRERITDLAHGIDDLIDRDAARDAGNGHVRRAHGIDRTDDVALDARHLTSPATGSQTSPSRFASAIAYASAHCCAVPPRICVSAAAAMALAVPISA